jgi:ribosome maturation factor RimP
VDLAALRERLRPLVEPVVAGAGYDLEDLAVARLGRDFVVRIVIDGDGGVGLDDIAEVSRALSAALDAAEADGQQISADAYTLEVSSPGVDRPLTLPRHWRRNVGRLVKVKAGARLLTGRVTAAGDSAVTLDVGGVEHELPYADLGPGRVQIEFTRLDELADTDDDLGAFLADGDGGEDPDSDGDEPIEGDDEE